MSKLNIKMVECNELPEEIDKNLCDRFSTFLLAYYDGKLLAWHSDGMESEDARFSRNLSWVPQLLRKVYELGIEEGKEELRGKLDMLHRSLL